MLDLCDVLCMLGLLLCVTVFSIIDLCDVLCGIVCVVCMMDFLKYAKHGIAESI